MSSRSAVVAYLYQRINTAWASAAFFCETTIGTLKSCVKLYCCTESIVVKKFFEKPQRMPTVLCSGKKDIQKKSLAQHS